MSLADCSACRRMECDRQQWPCACWCHREDYQRGRLLERLQFEREMLEPSWELFR